MKISIITAAVRKELMPRVWESVKKQTHKDWEWIIVNDASEGVREWFKENIEEMKKINPNIWMLDIGLNRGRFGLYARNAGTMVASNDNIVFLDDDNEWEEDHLESFITIKRKTGKIPYCWMHIKGKKEGSDFERIKKTHFGKQGIDLGCLLWTKKLFETYGYFRNDSQVTFDWNCMARVYYGEGPHNFACTEKSSLIFWHKRY